ncbi:MAG: YibE/F family protein [Desulfacinum sp.]|jgi:uncharacterized membrane protein|nr:YibE/F family protein [Desulfacinum sp.]MBZ4658384.1 YibE/F family protein [Desulfacinum sp.]
MGGPWRRRLAGFCAIVCLTAACFFFPSSYGHRVDDRAVRCTGRVVAVDDSQIHQFGLIRKGAQRVSLRIENGPFEGRRVQAVNQLLGRMDIDKVFRPGDRALVVLSLNPEGEIVFVAAQDHWRIGREVGLLGLFCLLLLAFAGWTGAKALGSFLFSVVFIWRVLIPAFLEGWDPVPVALAGTSLLTAVIIFMVAGFSWRGLTAFLGAMLGVFTSCVLAMVFVPLFHVNGAVLPFSETMLYAGYAHLSLPRLFTAAIFVAASGALMDLAVDVAAAMEEVARARPDYSFSRLLSSGLQVGRAVVGTMTTTLLLAYSGGYMTLLMAFMAQGVPVLNLMNHVYVASEILKTLVGSFGLVTVAPFTAVVGAFIFGRVRFSRAPAPRRSGVGNAVIGSRASTVSSSGFKGSAVS